MTFLDWAIAVVPTFAVLCIACRMRRHMRGMVDYLSAGRVCGRYVLTVGDIANGISILSIVSYCEMKYHAGYSVNIWGAALIPVSVTMSVFGYCTYRFRETRAQSFGQFIEMRYGSRALRVFSSTVRTFAEILTHAIMPAIAARFFLYYLGMPETFRVLGVEIGTFPAAMALCVSLAVFVIWHGGVLGIIVTDTIQGLICLPIMVLLCVFLLRRFGWGAEIEPVLLDRAAGESFVNPYQIAHLRDFNAFTLVVSAVSLVLHRASWIGSGADSAARSPHEQRMAGVLGTWRGFFSPLLYVLVSLAVLTLLHHERFAPEARSVRLELAGRVVRDLTDDAALRSRADAAFAAIPVQRHRIGVDPPMSDAENLDTPWIDAARAVFADEPRGAYLTQQFRSLYHQTMMSVTMRHLLGRGMMGLFCLLAILAMVSTDDSFLFASVRTIVQDMLLPFFRAPPPMRLHVWMIRIAAVAVALVHWTVSVTMAQLDFVELFIVAATSVWLGGCGPMIVFGLYGRRGTARTAWASLLSGMAISVGAILCQRLWAPAIYPWLDAHGWAPAVGRAFERLSAPLHPWVVWKMTPEKFPVNSYESFFLAMMASLVAYVAAALCSRAPLFDLDRMLHRGRWRIEGEAPPPPAPRSWRGALRLLAGIGPEHTSGDRILAWSVVAYSYGWKFLACFALLVAWNAVSPWSDHGWALYFLVCHVLVPTALVAVTSVWFTIGGIVGLRRLFRDLRLRADVDPLDNGMVSDGVSLSDRERFGKTK